MLFLLSFNLGFPFLECGLSVSCMRFWIDILILTSSGFSVPIAPIIEQYNLTAADSITSDKFTVPYKLFKSNFNLAEMNFPFHEKASLGHFRFKIT